MSAGRRSQTFGRHARSGAGRSRFGALALVAAGLLGLGAGAGTGTVLASASHGAGGAEAVGDAQVTASRQTSSAPSPGGTPVLATTPAATATATAAQAPTPLPLDSGRTAADVAAGILSQALPTSGSGTLVVVPGSEASPNGSAASIRTVRVEVEAGLDIDGPAFAAMVMATLNDARGWGSGGTLSFARTDGDAQIRVVLASPDLVDTLCAPLATNGTYSCGRNGHAVINHTRWVAGTSEFPDLTVYRQYVVNHEVGHLLGHPHVSCPGTGLLAPLMQQQTVSVGSCLPNAWPFPDAG